MRFFVKNKIKKSIIEGLLNYKSIFVVLNFYHSHKNNFQTII